MDFIKLKHTIKSTMMKGKVTFFFCFCLEICTIIFVFANIKNLDINEKIYKKIQIKNTILFFKNK